ncbi:hypothetical protein BH10BAC3_BH10BAC3_10270 [soil metagenome]
MNATVKELVAEAKINLSAIEIDGEVFYKISNVDEMRPFFMSIVSDSNHWMFIASNGGISAGRKNPDYALFPYYTDDKITESAEITGSKTIIQIHKNGNLCTWEPFSERSAGLYKCIRNLYKNRYGNSVLFEEINTDLGISFQYQWCSSNYYGFVRQCKLVNNSTDELAIKILDGLQNILPYGVGSDMQKNVSNLADAYKRSELIPQPGLGIFALSAIVVDKAEPSEALKANVVWQLGLQNPMYLLSSLQLKNFRTNGVVQLEEDVKGEKGAYFVGSEIILQPGEEKEWMIVANVNQNHSSIVQLSERIKNDEDLYKKVQADIKLGTENLIKLIAASDGLQSTADGLKDTRHYSNVLFNIMRGGIFDDNYQIEKWDFIKYIQKANQQVFKETQPHLEQLPPIFSVAELYIAVEHSNNINFLRLATEYLPLKFSRRHGDPSRPWNQFSINTRSEVDGSKSLDYQGNWRDIFQNWEALAHSYPEFMEGMIFKFLNASTFDGYNPYRVTKDGFDWETIEPDNPWSYIGYWGDHQIIYLLKFLEFSENHRPGHIQKLLNKNGFVYANVPYTIKSYQDILLNPKDTIEFDHKNDRSIHERIKSIGADGALLTTAQNEIYHVSFCEKILATVLAKLSNLVPDGGIWMNTQRPEWNDANNALVGNGLSMVTLYYLRRFLQFFEPVFEKDGAAELAISTELIVCFEKIAATFEQHKQILNGQIDDTARKQITDALGIAGSDYRNLIYADKFSGKKDTVTAKQVLAFIKTAKQFLEHAIVVNKRQDDLYHAYNLISYDDHTVQVAHLSEMLEGQVGVLSSFSLSAEESLKLLDALKSSSLYRQDQYSYILYPNKNLPKFLNKNTIPKQSAEKSLLLKKLLEEGNLSIIEKDNNGDLHFNGNFRNANDVAAALKNLDHHYHELIEKDKTLLLQIFEEVFCHKEFTGRSGAMYGYEGLGSIYWHMVSKLLLAVQETCLKAINDNADEETISRLITHYYEINEGIGVHKSPAVYGAFPTDPYSHTPFGKGAQQPGMTGQVKEDILCRYGELGVFVADGKLYFNPCLLKREEFLLEDKVFEYVDVNSTAKHISLKRGSLCFTYCQIPIIYKLDEENRIELIQRDGGTIKIEGLSLDLNQSKQIFERTSQITQLTVYIKSTDLK